MDLWDHLIYCVDFVNNNAVISGLSDLVQVYEAS